MIVIISSTWLVGWWVYWPTPPYWSIGTGGNNRGLCIHFMCVFVFMFVYKVFTIPILISPLLTDLNSQSVYRNILIKSFDHSCKNLPTSKTSLKKNHLIFVIPVLHHLGAKFYYAYIIFFRWRRCHLVAKNCPKKLKSSLVDGFWCLRYHNDCNELLFMMGSNDCRNAI